jgi:hypothetical protein
MTWSSSLLLPGNLGESEPGEVSEEDMMVTGREQNVKEMSVERERQTQGRAEMGASVDSGS